MAKCENVPALRTSLLSSFDLISAHALLASQSSRPQQHVVTLSGSGDEKRETLVKVRVSSSMVVVARCRLLVSCESGVSGCESGSMSGPSGSTTFTFRWFSVGEHKEGNDTSGRG